MKTMRFLLTVVGAALVLLSCYMMPRATTGNVSLSTAGSRSISSGSNLVHISLFSVKSVDGNLVGQTLYTFSSGLTYVEVAAGSKVTLTDIPAGTWAILVSAGRRDAGGNYVVTDYSWPYSLLTVAPGVDNPTTVTLQKSPASPVANLFGTDVIGVTNAGSVYAVTASQLYGVSGSSASPVASLAGLTVNGLDAGLRYTGGAPASTPFVSTETGIYYYNGGLQAEIANSKPISILQAAGFAYGTSNVALFYQNAAGFGGVSITGSGPAGIGSWMDFDSSKTIPGKPVYDFTVSANYAYIASKLGAFQGGSNLVTDSNAANNILTEATFFGVSDDSTILSLNVNQAGTSMYIGSSSGAWSATMTESPFALSNLTKISATSGDSIIKIAATSGYVAFLSQYNLYIMNSGSGNVTTYPFYSGIPGQLTGMTWTGSGSSTTLYVSGTASTSTGNPGGVISIPFAGLPN